MEPKKILLVEDDKLIAELYQRSLSQAGFWVEMASDGEEGILKAGQQRYDLILLDIMLPKKTGIEVLEALKSGNLLSKGSPVMVLSNLGQDDIISQCLSLGAVGYLVKSQNLPDEIVDKVKDFFLSVSAQ